MNEKYNIKNDNNTNQKVNENDSKIEMYHKSNPINDLTKENESNKNFNTDEDIIFSSNPKYIKKDILLFKNEILKDIKSFQTEIFEKTKTEEKYINDKIEKFTIQIQKFQEKIVELSNLINTDKAIREKVDSIMQFKNSVQEIIMTNGIRIDNIDKDFHENINRIDNVLRDTVLLPGILGISKYKNFREFMDYVGSELSKGVTFREKNYIDLNNYKTKLENAINDFAIKINNSIKNSNSYSDKCVKQLEKDINSNFDLYNDKLSSLRLENVLYSEEIRRTNEDLMKQIKKIILIKKELLNKFEEEMNLIKKDNSRVIKCFTGYKEQFYEMRKKFIYLSEFLRDVRFQKNIGEEMKRKDFYAASKTINNLNKNKVLEGNNIIKNTKRGSATYLIDINKLLIKADSDNENNIKFNTNKSDKKINDLLKEKEEETIYGKFLKEYKRTESQALDFDKKNKLEIINKKNINYNINEKEQKENIIKGNIDFRNKKNKKHLHHHIHHHNHQNNEKEYENEKSDEKLIKYNKNENFIQRRKNRLATISQKEHKINSPFIQLFDLTYNDTDYYQKENRSIKKRIFKRLVTQNLDSIDIANKMKKINNLLNNKTFDWKHSSSDSNSFSKSSNSSSCSSCSCKSNSNNSRKNSKYRKIIDNKYNKIKTIKEEDKKYNNKIENKKTKNGNIIEIKDINNLKIDKETQNENNSIKKLNNKNTFSKNNKTFSNLNKEMVKNYVKKEDNINIDNYPNLNITNYKDKNIQNGSHIKNSSCKTNKQVNFKTSNSLQKIAISVEGSNKLIINPNKKENNKAQKNIIQNVQTMINEKIQNKTHNGFPKIVTNNGERIIFASHPVFHSKKFVNYISPNVLVLNHSIQTLFGNKLKHNKQQKSAKLNNLINNNNSEPNLEKKPYFNKPRIKEYENDLYNKNIYITDERLNTERQRIPSFINIINKKDPLYRGKNFSIKNLKAKNDYYNGCIKK